MSIPFVLKNIEDEVSEACVSSKTFWKMLMPLCRNILVTGGTRGLGLAFVRRLVSLGHNVAVTDISMKHALSMMKLV